MWDVFFSVHIECSSDEEKYMHVKKSFDFHEKRKHSPNNGHKNTDHSYFIFYPQRAKYNFHNFVSSHKLRYIYALVAPKLYIFIKNIYLCSILREKEKKRRENKQEIAKKECPLWGSNSRPLDAFSVIMRPTLYQLSQGDTNMATHNPNINWEPVTINQINVFPKCGMCDYFSFFFLCFQKNRNTFPFFWEYFPFLYSEIRKCNKKNENKVRTELN